MRRIPRLAHLPRRVVAPAALAMTLAVSAVPPVSAAETVHLFFRAHAGPVRVMGVTSNEVAMESISLEFAAAGLESDSAYRVVGSKRSCSRAHVSSATVFVQQLPKPGADRAVVSLDKSTPILAALESTRSVRVFTRRSGGTQALCTNEVLPIVATAPAGINLTKETIQLGILDGDIRGMTVGRYKEGGVNDMTFILVGLPPASISRLALTDTACAAPVTADDIVTSRRMEASATGVAAGVGVPVGLSLGRENSIECLSILQGGTGTKVRTAVPTSSFTRITLN